MWPELTRNEYQLQKVTLSQHELLGKEDETKIKAKENASQSIVGIMQDSGPSSWTVCLTCVFLYIHFLVVM